MPGRRDTCAPEVDSWVGRVVGDRYRLVELIGRGGMGRVYEAQHLGLARSVAIKLLDPSAVPAAAADPRRFAREAFAAGRLVHPNCVAVNDFGALPDGTLYMVMERLQGRPLADLIASEGRLPVTRALRIARHLLRGVEHAHAQGVVHRDLTPRNVFLVEHLGDRDFAKILDFGLAKLHGVAAKEEGRGKLTQTGIVCGTPRYIAPEQALGDEVDHRVDLYAVSAVLFEMIAGRPPFIAADLRALLLMHVGGQVPRFHEVAPGADVPVAVEMLVRRGLAKRPEHRPASAAELGAAIDDLLAAATAAPSASAQHGSACMPITIGQILVVRAPAQESSAWMPISTEQILTIPETAAVADRGPRGQEAGPPATGAGPRPTRRWRRGAVAGAMLGTAVLLAALASGWSSGADAQPPSDQKPALHAGPAAADDVRAPAAPAAQPAVAAGERRDSTAAPRNGKAVDDPLLGDLRRAAALRRAGRGADAERLLERLRAAHPRSASAARALGDLYAARPWPSQAVRAYRDAVRLDSGLRSDPQLIDAIIEQLSSRSAGWAAARLLVEIGAPALPRLEAAARHHPRPAMRARAARCLAAVRVSLG